MTAERAKLKDILAGDAWMKTATGSGMSTGDIAKALAPMTGLPAGVFHAVLEAGDQFGRHIGAESKTQDSRAIGAPYATAVRALVLAISRGRAPITSLFDTPKGAYVEAQMPKDFFSLGGALKFDVVDEGAKGVTIAAASEVKGQMFDWGKGKRSIRDVLDKTEEFAKRLSG